MKCVLYARVSTDKQAQKELSIPAQLTAMRQFAKSQSWRVIAEYVDEGESARSMNRPQLQQLIRFCKEKKGVDVVLVHKLDRMARNLPDYLAIKTELKRKGIRLVSAMENFEDSVTGRLLENIIASISEWYSGNLGEEIKKASFAKLQKGEWPHKAPIGYKSARDEQNKVSHVEDPDRSLLVRQAFELYATGEYALATLSEELYDRGLRTKHGKPLSQERVKRLLSNPFYLGVMRWNGKEYPGKHPSLIAKELFYRVQDILRTRHTDTGEKGSRQFLLRGVAFCGSCGQRLTAEVHPRGSYYRCPSHAFAKKCNERYTRVKDLDDQLSLIYQRLQPPQGVLELVRENIHVIAQRREGIAKREMEGLKRKLSDIEAKELKLADSFVSESLTKDAYQKLAESFRHNREQTETRLAQLNVDHKDPLDFFDKAAFTSSVLHTLHKRFRYEQRKTLLRAVFKRIEVQERAIIGFELNPPFSFFLQNGLNTMFEDRPVGATS